MKLYRILAVALLLVAGAFAATKNYSGAVVDAPVVLTTTGPTSGTTTHGQPYTATTYSATLANDDIYMVSVNSYGFQVVEGDLDKAVNAFAAADGVNGKILNNVTTSVSGHAARSAVIESVQGKRTLRFFLLVTYRGNVAYMYLFGTWMDTDGTDKEAVKTFFTSASIE